MKRFFENKSVNRLAQALKKNGRFDEAAERKGKIRRFPLRMRKGTSKGLGQAV